MDLELLEECSNQYLNHAKWVRLKSIRIDFHDPQINALSDEEFKRFVNSMNASMSTCLGDFMGYDFSDKKGPFSYGQNYADPIPRFKWSSREYIEAGFSSAGDALLEVMRAYDDGKPQPENTMVIVGYDENTEERYKERLAARLTRDVEVMNEEIIKRVLNGRSAKEFLAGCSIRFDVFEDEASRQYGAEFAKYMKTASAVGKGMGNVASVIDHVDMPKGHSGAKGRSNGLWKIVLVVVVIFLLLKGCGACG